MARTAYIETLIGGLDSTLRRALKQVFEYVLGNLRLGRIEDKQRAENFQMFFFKATTPTTANTEFEIVHGFGRAPYLLLPVLPLDVVGAKMVRLEVSKASDANRIYLKSPETDATFYVGLEV